MGHPIPQPYFKDEEIIEYIHPAESTSLPAEGKEAMGKLCDAMKGVCDFYDCDFGDMTEMHEVDVEKKLAGKEDSVLVDLPYCV